MLDMNFVQNFCIENLDQVKITKNGSSILARCPICHDSNKSSTKKRFHLDLKQDWIYHCFNCNTAGNFIGLYAHIKGMSYKDAYREIYSFEKQIENFKKEVHIKEEKKEYIEQNFNDILVDCISEKDFPNSIVQTKLLEKLKEFRESRKIFNYPLFVCFNGQYRNRIIIPIYKGSDIVYFQARAINDSNLKYINPEVEKSSIILNENNFNKEKHIIITEGILDALSVENGTTCLGASISNDFIETLYTKTNKNIIIALDNDERGIQETINILETSSFSEKLLYFITPFKEKDLNELLVNSSSENLYEIVVENSFTKFEVNLKQSLEGLWHEVSNKRKALCRGNGRGSSNFNFSDRKSPFAENLF